MRFKEESQIENQPKNYLQPDSIIYDQTESQIYDKSQMKNLLAGLIGFNDLNIEMSIPQGCWVGQFEETFSERELWVKTWKYESNLRK